MEGTASTSTFSGDIDPGQLSSLRQGCPAALAAAYDRFARPAYGLAIRVLGNPEDAADLVQDVFLRLPRASRQFRGDAPFGAWLRKLVANATIDRLRERKRLVPLDQAHVELGLDSGVLDAIHAGELLQRLSPTARLVLLLHAVEGMTHAEMAVLFQQSESYSKSILSRALKRLRDLYRSDSPVPP
ncbi:RNA polymerase sigma factor [Pseudofulvimonas gallinarii]|jgi:DNA-directed RNA polymerase specialized sigma24 family protein|uniref:RNA polymerase sigma-70 factor (ECF subfamily) n=1 Tax=Pseudofulvimonas gallinarii TaxID=634155 RepID=A0A4R3L3M7_9GAMM|nr:sigma-70 family RNA polymerase sigma factor [Pseudofulvimonas gallinarii]TCS93528.1 RNA polymerase sigma-70 factor (ECF subfamily) [Pseudofulvimonas gallinarii]THD14441.1 hypothetical protein B1808_04055 [Pseudofulvimonas gallinarii]